MAIANKRLIRQGDVLFIPVGGLDYVEARWPSRGDKWQRPEDVRDGIIQRGEATGHDHRLSPESLVGDDEGMGRRSFLKRIGIGAGSLLFLITGAAGAKVIQSGNPGEVEGVDLHRPVELDADTTYQAVLAREFDYGADEARYVSD